MCNPLQLWIVAHQAPLCLWDFFRQEYWSGLSSPSPEDLPNLEIEPTFPALQVHSLPTEPSGKPITVFKITFFYYKSDISYG